MGFSGGKFATCYCQFRTLSIFGKKWEVFTRAEALIRINMIAVD